MEYLLNFGQYDDDYEEFPGPEDDDGENVTPEDNDPEEDG
jgi:hypothetical protein